MARASSGLCTRLDVTHHVLIRVMGLVPAAVDFYVLAR
jgi:hypothetical protein